MDRKEHDLTTADLADSSAKTAEAAADERGPVRGDAVQETSAEEDVEVDAAARSAVTDEEITEPLLAPDEAKRFQRSWEEIQVRFVDEPRRSVERADALVADVMQRIAASFSDARTRLESQWGRGDDVSTEDLRVALTRYRSFFERLLSA